VLSMDRIQLLNILQTLAFQTVFSEHIEKDVSINIKDKDWGKDKIISIKIETDEENIFYNM